MRLRWIVEGRRVQSDVRKVQIATAMATAHQMIVTKEFAFPYLVRTANMIPTRPMSIAEASSVGLVRLVRNAGLTRTALRACAQSLPLDVSPPSAPRIVEDRVILVQIPHLVPRPRIVCLGIATGKRPI